jgi:hypothetical protein
VPSRTLQQQRQQVAQEQQQQKLDLCLYRATHACTSSSHTAKELAATKLTLST